MSERTIVARRFWIGWSIVFGLFSLGCLTTDTGTWWLHVVAVGVHTSLIARYLWGDR